MQKERYLTENETNSIKSLIVKRGLDIGLVAKKMNISRATLSSRVNGKTDFTRTEMEKFSEIIDAKAEVIFFMQ